MESNEVIVAMEHGFAELRHEMNDRFERVDNELRKLAILEDMEGHIRQIAEGRNATEEKLNQHLEEGGAPLEERVIKLEFRVDTLEKKRRRN